MMMLAVGNKRFVSFLLLCMASSSCTSTSYVVGGNHHSNGITIKSARVTETSTLLIAFSVENKKTQPICIKEAIASSADTFLAELEVNNNKRNIVGYIPEESPHSTQLLPGEIRENTLDFGDWKIPLPKMKRPAYVKLKIEAVICETPRIFYRPDFVLESQWKEIE